MHDVIIIGGGFAGHAAALQLARASRDVLIIDAGAPRNRFAAHSHGVLGHDGKPPFQLLSEAVEQLAAYPTAWLKQGRAVSAEGSRDTFTVRLEGGEVLQARRLILASGVVDIMPDLPGFAERWGQSVLHCPYCHGYEVRGGPLGVLGGHARAGHQAQLIAEWGPTTLFVPSDFPLDAEQRAQVEASGVIIETTPVVGLMGPGRALEGASLADGRVAPLTALFAAPAVRQASPLAQQLGCAFEEGPLGPYIVTDLWKATSQAGVFSAGDAARPMHNLSLAVADGVLAGVGAHQSLVFNS